MKKILIILCALLFAQINCSVNASSKLSPAAYQLSKSLQVKSKISDKLMADSIIVSLLFKFNDNFDFKKATAIGANINTISGKIATGRVAINKYLDFIDLPGIEYIEAENCVAPMMDSAKSVAHIQEVINGEQLSKSYNGEGVVVGIIDAGFDYTHPAFVDPGTNKLIISRVWEQGKTGTAPSGFSYGRELIGDSLIIQAKTDVEDFSHGTHVAGIAVGQNVEKAKSSVGIATKSELVIVALKPPAQEQWKNTAASDMIDGVNYIFQYAKSIGKPAVVNLSWGGQIGPHDGTSLFSQAIDGLVGEGKIFVNSAGNDGDVTLHINKTLKENAPLVTYILNHYDKTKPKNGIWIDAWGEIEKPFEFNFEVVDKATLKTKYQTEFHSTLKDTVINYLFKEGNDTCNITVYLNKCAYNNKPHAFVSVECNQQFRFKISAKAPEGTVNIWNWYLIDYYGIERPFVAANDSTAIAGNTICTISDFASGKKAIAVGAMVSKSAYKNSSGGTINLNGKYGDIASFSSKGPTVDNRVKPDIVAPGFALSSAVSLYDKSFATNGASANYVTVRVTHNDNQYPYACLAGTSMSSPVVAGAVALMLSADPKLTPEKIIDLLKSNATVDNYTKEVPNPVWGWGKLNLRKAFNYVGIDELNYCKNSTNVYPNPTTLGSATIALELENTCNLRIVLSDVIGREILPIYDGTAEAGTFTKSFTTQNLHKGIYFIKTLIDGKYKLEKIVVND